MSRKFQVQGAKVRGKHGSRSWRANCMAIKAAGTWWRRPSGQAKAATPFWRGELKFNTKFSQLRARPCGWDRRRVWSGTCSTGPWVCSNTLSVSCCSQNAFRFGESQTMQAEEQTVGKLSGKAGKDTLGTDSLSGFSLLNDSAQRQLSRSSSTWMKSGTEPWPLLVFTPQFAEEAQDDESFFSLTTYIILLIYMIRDLTKTNTNVFWIWCC